MTRPTVKIDPSRLLGFRIATTESTLAGAENALGSKVGDSKTMGAAVGMKPKPPGPAVGMKKVPGAMIGGGKPRDSRMGANIGGKGGPG